MAYSGGFPDDQELLSPRVSISWNVIGSYKSENVNFKRSIECHNSSHSYHDVFASIASTNDDYMSPQSRDIISRMIAHINFPFELDMLSWKRRFDRNNTIKPLNSVDDIISQILEVINGMVVSGRKKVDLIVEVDKQYTLAHEEYQAKVQAIKERELTEIRRNLDAVLLRELARVQNQRQADMIKRAYAEQCRRIEDEMRANNISQERIMDNARFLEQEAIRESFDQVVNRPRPASKASIQALEKFVLEDKDGGSSSICVICREELTACKVIRMPCSHMFHDDCIVEWLNHWGHTCPLCKFNLPKEKKHGSEELKRS
ncbi:putative transcription factor C2H2 family [Rosa chinensis]|uniref:RING-type E3 ubiquitin transferase n=1 Tax=Rosa chinensis TaxID=74649 RepID=A0A2P6P7P1_ROSCH|nr:putative transcription factor C2H2 family [Rosa chinensis]